MTLEEVLTKLHSRGAVDATIKKDMIVFPDGERMHIFDRWKLKDNLIELVDDSNPDDSRYSYILYKEPEY